MDNVIYTTVSRQIGLERELQTIANNLANSTTTGFKSDAAIFVEYLFSTGPNTPSLSMGSLAGHSFNLEQGGIKNTGGILDLAIEGPGFFVLDTQAGPMLSRNGHFQLSNDGFVIDAIGNKVLNSSGTPISIPEDADKIYISGDGTISTSAGGIVDTIGVVQAQGEIIRAGDNYFVSQDGYVASESSKIRQGSLEQSNVSPVMEMARMIAVQRNYEAGQTILESEDQRLDKLIRTVKEK